ncbi:MAG: hypothetical protein ACTSUT_13275 [Promethearchaeota archaeon]
MSKEKSPYCPFCYNGTIIYLKKHNVFICNRCFKQVKINGWGEK